MENRFTLMRQSCTGEDLRSIFVQQAHGTHVPGNKTPLMCALCLAEGEKAAHAYIIGGVEGRGFWWGYYFEITFFSFFWLCNSFACWWKIDVNHSPWLLSNIHSPSTHSILSALVCCHSASPPLLPSFHLLIPLLVFKCRCPILLSTQTKSVSKWKKKKRSCTSSFWIFI